MCGGSEVRVHVHVLFIVYDKSVDEGGSECGGGMSDHHGGMNAAEQLRLEMIELS